MTLQRGFRYRPKETKYVPQAEDRGRATVFYDPSCPFCASFSGRITKLVEHAAPGIPIRLINRFGEAEEAWKRGKTPLCIIDGEPVEAFFFDAKNFKKEIREKRGKC